jgi:hypothetical protein
MADRTSKADGVLAQLARASGGMAYDGSPIGHLAALAAMTVVLVGLAARKLARTG